MKWKVLVIEKKMKIVGERSEMWRKKLVCISSSGKVEENDSNEERK